MNDSYEYPARVEEGKDEGGQEGDEHEDTVGQVVGRLIRIRLHHRVPHQSIPIQIKVSVRKYRIKGVYAKKD